MIEEHGTFKAYFDQSHIQQWDEAQERYQEAFEERLFDDQDLDNIVALGSTTLTKSDVQLATKTQTFGAGEDDMNYTALHHAAVLTRYGWAKKQSFQLGYKNDENLETGNRTGEIELPAPDGGGDIKFRYVEL